MFTDAANLRRALTYIRESENTAELAPCDTLDEAMETAKKKGIPALISFVGGGKKKMEVQA